jgi:hypothetical protein
MPNPGKRAARRAAKFRLEMKLESMFVSPFVEFKKSPFLYGSAKLKMSLPAAMATYCFPLTA